MKENETITNTQTTLIDTIVKSDLSTFSITYNGVAKKESESFGKKKVDYYVSYQSKVQAGIDFSKIKFEKNDEKKQIRIVQPEVQIMDINVDIESFDYIFINKKSETKTVASETYALVNEDVHKSINEEQAVIDYARENATNIINALSEPFRDKLKKYDWEIVVEVQE